MKTGERQARNFPTELIQLISSYVEHLVRTYGDSLTAARLASPPNVRYELSGSRSSHSQLFIEYCHTAIERLIALSDIGFRSMIGI